MPSARREAVSVACPRCGHQQPEHPGAYSTLCKHCGEHYRVQDALRPPPKTAAAEIALRRVPCFQCGTMLEAPRTAASTMCKRCSSHVDLSDYKIAQTVSRSYRTHGRLVLEEKGYLLNTDSVVEHAVLKGKLFGRLVVRQRLEVYSTASVKGVFSAGEFSVPAGNDFQWPEPIRAGAVDIAGELSAPLQVSGLIRVRSTGRLFGDIEASALIVEEGAVLVGSARIGCMIR